MPSSNNPSKQAPILIAGAGPVGLTAALELARRGIPVRVIEKNLKRSPFSKALGITARSLQLLEACEVTPRLMEAGRQATDAAIRRDGKDVVRIQFKELLEPPWNFILVLPQSDTEDILETRLAELGVLVERGVELDGLTQHEGEVRAEVETPEGPQTISTPYLIATDGAHSTARHILGLDFPGETMEGEWSLADVRADLPIDTTGLTIDMGSERLLFAIRIRDDIYRLASNKPEVENHLPEGSQLEEVLWQSAFTINHRQIESYQHGRVFFAGDSAHVHSPLGGRGMNLGIDDACALVDLLSTGRLEEYAPWRQQVGAKVIRQVRFLTYIAAGVNAPARLARNRLLPLVLHSPKARQTLARRIVDSTRPGKAVPDQT